MNIVKPFIKAIAFMLVFVLLLVISSQLLQPKNNDEESGILDYRANGILSEKENTVEVLVLGDSESYCGFCPKTLSREYGINSYVCGTSGQTLCYSDEFLRKVFETQSPKLVVLEAHTVLTSYGMAGRLTYKLEQLFPVFRYHDRWKTASLKEMLSPVSYHAVCEDRGYYYSEEIKGTEPGDYMANLGQVNSVSARNKRYIGSMRDFCEKRGARLLLVSVPSSLNWNYANHCAIDNMASELNIEYLDMNLLNDEIKIDWSNDTLDAGDHLNIYGAEKATAYFGSYITQNNLLEH